MGHGISCIFISVAVCVFCVNKWQLTMARSGKNEWIGCMKIVNTQSIMLSIEYTEYHE